MKYTKEWGLQICTKQHGVWGRLYFPKLAREVSPILRALLQHDPSTRHDAIESDFPALESELAIVTVLKAVRGNRTDTMRFEGQGQKKPCSICLVLLKYLLSRHSSLGCAASQNPVICHTVKRSSPETAMCRCLGH